jgi:hypothetical protein
MWVCSLVAHGGPLGPVRVADGGSYIPVQRADVSTVLFTLGYVYLVMADAFYGRWGRQLVAAAPAGSGYADRGATVIRALASGAVP